MRQNPYAAFSRAELAALRRLHTPEKIQDFLDRSVAYNTEPNGDMCASPRSVLRTKTAHCIEGAMLAACALRLAGHRALIVDFEAERDLDHVICVFKRHGRWGAISMSRYLTLRYRNPVYRTIRELVMSYFPFYNNDAGELTLRRYSNPVNLQRFDRIGWMTRDTDVWEVPEYLLTVRHHAILPATVRTRLRRLSRQFLQRDRV